MTNESVSPRDLVAIDNRPTNPNSIVHVTRYRSTTNTTPNYTPVSWPALVAELITRGHLVVPSKLAGPLWSPVKIADGGKRSNAFVEALSCIVLDLDHKTEGEIAFVVDDLIANGLECLIHTTHSHDPDGVLNKKPDGSLVGVVDWRVRVILPLDAPVTPNVYQQLWAATAARWGTDPSCKDTSRMYFLPSRAPDAPDGLHWISHLPGRRLSPADLPCVAIVKATPNGLAIPSIGGMPDFDGQAIDPCPPGVAPVEHGAYLAKTMPESVAGAKGQTALLRLARALVWGLCLSPEQTTALIHEHFNPRCTYQNGAPYPWTDAEIAHKIASAGKPEGATYPRGALLPKVGRCVDTESLKKTVGHWAKGKGAPADDAAKFLRGLGGEPICHRHDEVRPVIANVTRRIIAAYPDIDAEEFAEKLRASLDNPIYSNDRRGVPTVAEVVQMVKQFRDAKIALRSENDLARLRQIFTEDPKYAGRFRLDTLANKPYDQTHGAHVGDDDLTNFRIDISERFAFDPKPQDTASVLRSTSAENSFHPVVDFLDGAVRGYDAKNPAPPLADLFNVERTALNEWTLQAHLVAAVARAYEPGAQVDVVAILESQQGFKKSSGIEALCPNRSWFTDAAIDWKKPVEAALLLQGIWLVEIPEIDGFRGNDVQTVKSFISRKHDRYRAPYAVSAADHPRTCVFFATTNARHYFQDKTGNRRYRALKMVGSIDTARIVQYRDALWAEAVARYRSGFVFWEAPEALSADLENAQHERREADALDDFLTDWRPQMKADEGISFQDVYTAVRAAGINRHDVRVSEALTAVGWVRRQNIGPKKLKRWFPR